jgi:multidrug transporter EmrE-like cation transporter
MIKVFFLFFESAGTWDRISQAQRSLIYVFTTHLLPILALVGFVEGWGLHHWGKWQPRFHLLKDFSITTVVTYEVIQLILSAVMVLVSALLLLKISRTFHSRGTYTQAFTAVAYAFSPMFLMRMLNAVPSANPWAIWGIGIAMSLWVFYQGLPRVLQPDPTHAFGLYLSMIFVMLLTSGIERVMTALYLLGYIDLQNSYLARAFPSFFQ